MGLVQGKISISDPPLMKGDLYHWMMVPEPPGKNNIFNQVSEGMLAPVGKSIWGLMAPVLWCSGAG